LFHFAQHRHGGAGGTPAAPATSTPTSDPAALAKLRPRTCSAPIAGSGPALTAQQAKAGMNCINDVDKLVETGKIIPLDSAGSRIVQRRCAARCRRRARACRR